ncbi:MAG: methyltransferase domain-containing protein [Candidatus Scalindua sp.]
MDTIRIAKALMKIVENVPPPPKNDETGELNEIFNHNNFVRGSEAERRAIMLNSSTSKYKSELEYPWDHYFGVDIFKFLHTKIVLDLGCFTGGRGVAWVERYKLNHLVGIDVKQEYIDAAAQFAAAKKINAEFKVSKGETLPFEDETFDAILSFDVFEHLQNVQTTLDECYRVLKPNGRLYVVFPSYFHPKEHHLDFVTKLPIHYFFSGKTLVKSYYDILKERGKDAYWYKRNNPNLEYWEHGNTINGTTLALFRKIIEKTNWKIIHHSKKPIGSIGRNISKKRILKMMSSLFYLLTLIPGLQEVFLHRITFILEKRQP